MDGQKSFEVWLGVKLKVDVSYKTGSETPWSGDAVARGSEWLIELMQAAGAITPDISVAGPVVDLSDAAVRLLNQTGEERSRSATTESASCPDL